jgi:hypothetical protein
MSRGHCKLQTALFGIILVSKINKINKLAWTPWDTLDTPATR